MGMTQYAGKESDYLKATDLKGKTPTVVIESVSLVEFDDDKGKKQVKPALKLVGKDKQLVCNPTNTEKLIRKYGADSEGWQGKQILLGTEYYPKFDREGIVITPLDSDGPDDEIPF